MPEIQRAFKLNVTREEVWSYFSDIANLASYIPGLQEHRIITETSSYWKLKVKLPMLSETVELVANITYLDEPKSVAFSMKATNHNVEGYGLVILASQSGNETEVTLNLNVKAGGVMAPFINRLISIGLPKLVDGLVEKVSKREPAIT